MSFLKTYSLKNELLYRIIWFYSFHICLVNQIVFKSLFNRRCGTYCEKGHVTRTEEHDDDMAGKPIKAGNSRMVASALVTERAGLRRASHTKDRLCPMRAFCVNFCINKLF